jgi:hypothetical protein
MTGSKFRVDTARPLPQQPQLRSFSRNHCVDLTADLSVKWMVCKHKYALNNFPSTFSKVFSLLLLFSSDTIISVTIEFPFLRIISVTITISVHGQQYFPITVQLTCRKISLVTSIWCTQVYLYRNIVIIMTRKVWRIRRSQALKSSRDLSTKAHAAV